LKSYFQSNLINLDVTKQQFNLLRSVQATPRETEQVMGYLKYQQDSWVTLRDDLKHPWYKEAALGLTTLLRNEIPVNELTFLVHLESRWLLALSQGEVIPAVFLFTEHAKDGLSVSFYRILQLNGQWYDELRKLVYELLVFSQKTEEIEHKPTIMDEYRLQI
jgi:hypothetical protein